ncbi:hypothetical protein KUTeg_022096 [Tegillarca granosa]|uniref:Uncharacterized protein n=1 Tax=Tegillarca granosa TaxID=220873 RepID=A0ABQ9E5M2_TEGGR|nr:hypothetical protein KUTeg_022096 [Tegillarca granosa]
MAEKKYDLALINTKTDKKIRLQPWYKERLQTKHIKSLDKKDTSRSLVGKNWIFMRDGLDDFRDGLPPLVEGDIFIKGQKGPGPNVKGSSENVQSVKQPAVRKRFTKYQTCYSRLTPLQQQRRDHIEEIEYGLAQHPLALYPHLNESVDPQLFEDIVDILDPEMNFDEEGSLAEEEEDEEVSDNFDDEKDSQREDSKSDVDKDTQGSEEPAPLRNFYRWLPRKDEKDPKDKKKGQRRTH